MAMAIFMYSSYDTTPWTEAISGGLVICASIVLWLTHHHDDAPDTDTADDATPAPMTRAS
jgi:hypothetical protein